MNTFPRGSEWHRWDLHLHTASSYDYEYKSDDADKLLTDALKADGVVAAAITDHFVIDKERIEKLRTLAPEIVFFPGVELRTDKGDTNIHVILIFSDEIDLNILVESFNVFKREKGKEVSCNERIYWDCNNIVEFAKRHDALISIHAGRKTNGVDDRITNKLEHNQAVKAEYAESVHIFEMGQVRDIDEYRKKVFPTIGKRPLVICSDNHNPNSYNPSDKLWIKADVTFNGLKQIIFEPEERIRIEATKPEIKPLYQVIDSVSFIENENFQAEPIVFNQNLNCIIGGKSTGKSLLLHNIAASIDPEQAKIKIRYINEIDHTSNKKSIHTAPKISVSWLDSNDTSNRKIVYIPQKYLNRLADDDESTTTVDELIKKIVLSKMDVDGNKLEIAEQTMQNKVDGLLSDGAKKLIDIIRHHSSIQEYDSKIKELGGELLVNQEIARLKAEIQSLSVKYNFDEKDFLRYDEIILKLSENEKLIHNIGKDIVAIQELKQVFHIDDIGLNDNETMEVVTDVLNTLITKVNELWENEKEKILQGLHARIVLSKNEIELLTTEKEILQPKIDKNNELKEKSKQITIEIAKSLDIKNFIAQKALFEEQLLRLIHEIAQEYVCGLKSICEMYAEYINRNTSAISSDMTFEVQVRMKNNDFIERWREIYGLRPKDAETYLVQWLEGDDNSKVKYETNFIINAINKTLDGSFIPLKNKTAQEALSNLLLNWFTIKYVVKMGDDTVDSMSPGKKALVLLKLLIELEESTCPILIDQPEDDLDNRSIYDQLIGFIKTKKIARQIIIVTHNANIVVGADSEEIVVANQHGNDTKNKNRKFEYRSGSIENDRPIYKTDSVIAEDGVLNEQGIQQHICAILEGGEKAFELRKQKYHI